MQRLNRRLLPLLLLPSLALATESELSTRVVGGDDSNDGDWPWMVSVFAGDFFCGGSLIDEDTVMTAAHCLHDENNDEIDASDIFVVVDEYDLEQIDTRDFSPISRTYIHSGYDPEPGVSSNDIALLRLRRSETDVTPVERLSASFTTAAIAAQFDVTILGWGSTVGYDVGESVIPNYPDILQEATLPLKTNSQCASVYGSTFDRTTMLCAGEDDGGIDACQGDSGGPLVYNNGGAWQQIGIVSFGSGCASAEFPGVYARVATYEDWIDNFLNGVTTDSELAFNAATNSSETQTLTLYNNGDSDATLSMSLSGSDEFSYDNSQCSSIGANDSCSLSITYSPLSAETSSTATLTIDTDLADATSITTTLTGNVGSTASTSSSSGGGSLLFIGLLPMLLLRFRQRRQAQ